MTSLVIEQHRAAPGPLDPSAHAVLNSLPALVFDVSVDRDGRVQRMQFVTDHVERMLGYAPRQCLSSPEFWLDIVHPDDRERVRSELSAVAGRGSGRLEFRCVARDGRTVWVESHCTTVRDGSGRPIAVRGVVTDISRLKRAQQALRSRASKLIRVARQLKRSNDELDQFAYITSHDLRAPLRGIANLSQWIEEDIGEGFPPEAHKQMELLRGRVNRMEALINGLLQYSRVGRLQIRPERVDVGMLVREVIDLLAPPPGFKFELAPDLPVLESAKRLRLQQVFLNLIGNAIKHHDRPQQGRVSVGWRDAGGGFYEFRVSDNGPGIEPQFHDRIFVIFQTLQPRDKVEGSGVGLSLVKKIVEQQGGSIRLQSRPGEGSTFSFTWPRCVSDAKGAAVR